ncbi:MAG TPA: hypothetical protein P5123_11535 [Spirochaetota bacterium]|nr:hypothetical protein [Spirochaetota bacterium]
MMISANFKHKNKLFSAFLSLLFTFTVAGIPGPEYDVRVSGIRFLYGTGVGPTHSGLYNSSNYYRSYGQSGTLIELTAQMNVSGWTHMYGPVAFTVSFSNGSNTASFDVTIPSGQNRVIALVPFSDASGFPDSFITNGQTIPFEYTVTAASGQHADNLISSVSQTIYWDRNDPPQSSVFPPADETEISVSLTTNSARIMWSPLVTSTSGGYYNSDFYEYRIRFREFSEEDQNPWRIWNSSNDPTLKGTVFNPPAYPSDNPSYHFSNGMKYTVIPRLSLFTRYEFYISAVDVFGNESPAPAEYFMMMTQPYSVEASVSDGRVKYDDFTNLNDPSLRPVTESNIRVDLNIVSTDVSPDEVRVWYTAESDSLSIVGADNRVNEDEFPENSLYSVGAVATNQNRWTAYMSSDSNAITDGSTVRFIVETITGGASTFSDADISDLDPNNNEWNFVVRNLHTFTPQPVRILNNVLTDSNPLAYPSYYLTEDAYVTITVHDVKGRRVSTILEKAFRRAGQNIKEKGWNGSNRAGRKLGVGLYYIKIVAKNKNGKTVLSEVKKVVVAK